MTEELGEAKPCASLRAATRFTGEPQENDVKLLIYVFITFAVLKIKPLEPCPCQASASGVHSPSSCSSVLKYCLSLCSFVPKINKQGQKRGRF